MVSRLTSFNEARETASTRAGDGTKPAVSAWEAERDGGAVDGQGGRDLAVELGDVGHGDRDGVAGGGRAAGLAEGHRGRGRDGERHGAVGRGEHERSGELVLGGLAHRDGAR